jgi:hypothetical protein
VLILALLLDFITDFMIVEESGDGTARFADKCHTMAGCQIMMKGRHGPPHARPMFDVRRMCLGLCTTPEAPKRFADVSWLHVADVAMARPE